MMENVTQLRRVSLADAVDSLGDLQGTPRGHLVARILRIL